MREPWTWFALAALAFCAGNCGDDGTSSPQDDGTVADDGRAEIDADDGETDAPGADGDADAAPDATTDDGEDGPCVPVCDDGRICGATDDCGGTCMTGWCAAGSTCTDGSCTCDDVDCFGTCCGAREVCATGTCCAPDCAARTCGLDTRCGSPCGTCTTGICDGGTCGTPACTPVAPEEVARPYRVHRNALAVDSSGLPHVLYSGDTLDWDGSYRVVHAVRSDGAWAKQIIDTVDQWGANFWADTDTADRVHAGYFPISTEGGPPRYATNASGTWLFSWPPLAGATDVRFLGADGRPHYFYAESGWRHLTDVDGLWTSESLGYLGGDCSFDIDPDGHVHAACLEGVCDLPRGYTETLVYQTNASGDWLRTNVADLADCMRGGPSDVKVDSSGTVHLAYIDSGMRYATNAGGSWAVEDLDPTRRGTHALAVDGTGRPHVVFAADGRTFYAVRGSGGWRIDDVDASSTSNEPVIRTDGIGRAHLLYSLDGSGDSRLMYAARCP
ncbi:MAG: hypothetical protein HY907_16735 [Deltaproteobacteria bacterium]|nr:hypothetical protein [Deltaproteobacteria bacterium]